MRQLQRVIFILIFIGIILIVCFSSLQSDKIIPYIVKQGLITKKSIDDFTQCLLYMDRALNVSSIPWFVTHGSALMYWRSKNFISDDMDIGVFYEDLQAMELNETEFLLDMKNKFHFKLAQTYGQFNHGKEWTFLCPNARINIDIFVFYPFNETGNFSYSYWAASYNGLCEHTIHRKCRWGFPEFNLTTFELLGKTFKIVSLDFIIERYGKDYRIPKKYDYFQSLTILPNLIPEYMNRSTTKSPRKKSPKRSSKLRRRFLFF